MSTKPLTFLNHAMKHSFFLAIICIGFGSVNGQTGRPNNVLVTNDDGWATAQIRAQFEALEAAGFNVRKYSSHCLKSLTLYVLVQLVLSCPAINRSGTGSSTAPPTTLTAPCEFNTCATGSPPEGSDPEDRKETQCIRKLRELTTRSSSSSELCQFVPACILLILANDANLQSLQCRFSSLRNSDPKPTVLWGLA